VNIVRTVTRKSSNGLKFNWLKVIRCIRHSNELEGEIKHKTGGSKQGAAFGGYGSPRPPLRTAADSMLHQKVRLVK